MEDHAPLGRRKLLVGAAAIATTAPLAHRALAAPSEIVNVAVLGCGRGASLAQSFAKLADSQVVAICDIDRGRGAALCEKIEQISGRRPEYVVDYRTLLERKDIDALVVATPDHWHAPVTINACIAGKDVYVEKPASHNVREGRLAVEAARKYKRIVQHGTNLRAAPHYQKAWKLLADGVIGKIMMVKAINNQQRGRMEHRQDESVPAGVDYDLWIGPAPKLPFNRNRFHTGWHWLWDYGTGDLGNDGVHQVDLGRWALNLGAPKAVSCSGAKLGWKGDAHEVPDAMVVTWEYEDLLYVFEQRDFTPYRMPAHQLDNDNIFYGDAGYMMVDRDGYRVFHRRGKPGVSYHKKWTDDGAHYQNFVSCVKSRRQEELNADILEGHYSAMLCHLGNIAYRTGKRLEFDGETETFTNDVSANALLSREYRKGYELPSI